VIYLKGHSGSFEMAPFNSRILLPVSIL